MLYSVGDDIYASILIEDDNTFALKTIEDEKEMEIVKDYADILDALSTSKLPAKWALSKNDIGMKVDKWLNMIKERWKKYGRK